MAGENPQPTSEEERKLLQRWVDLYQFVPKEYRKQLPSSIMNLWYGESGAKLVRHPLFDASVRAAMSAKEEFDKKDDKRRSARFLEFWHCRGLVYGCMKSQRREGIRQFPFVEFFLTNPGKPDQHVQIAEYDLPIANGQDVAIVYGRNITEEYGIPVLYCNFSMRQNIRLESDFSKLARKSAYGSGYGVPPDEELREFLVRNGLQ